MARGRSDAPDGGNATGFLDALVFIAFVALGAFYILIAKTAGIPAGWVTFVPVAIMIAYAATVRLAKGLLLRDDQTGDNLYYMGFLFTLTSLGVSLWQFTVSGAAEEIVRNFGVAIATTIAGIALRLFMNQMRRDPAEVERVTRLELADAARRVRRELDGTVVEMNHFRRSARQSAEEGLDDLRRLGEQAAALAEALEGATRRIGAGDAPEPRSGMRWPLAGSRPVETAGGRSEGLDRAVDRMAGLLADHAAAMDRLAAALARHAEQLTAPLEQPPDGDPAAPYAPVDHPPERRPPAAEDRPTEPRPPEPRPPEPRPPEPGPPGAAAPETRSPAAFAAAEIEETAR
ncbi:hypothetical protein [Chthonobacter rhizosphaerae]|uniref:hypothetical protein n=1 Tax=Chthonobacter rhizosphaerae TaxID=2735553 RepID=UPI0015EEFC6E|nr:hypothetical protein [Chthonobacter rhizosphaerae]